MIILLTVLMLGCTFYLGYFCSELKWVKKLKKSNRSSNVQGNSDIEYARVRGRLDVIGELLD